ncbi:transmembrane protease serine 9-like [Toxorhynchites rutilus septentrionalis]|uniref:transmembrane protease serine 9-like n=1 Tax=Toxorhynchites rutilus septentrionalis TaxID=329112 RepID=UPI002478E9CE|nr:transmembrane protease serine 9-like [Toxorhynchites rutilus septentrionalis]
MKSTTVRAQFISTQIATMLVGILLVVFALNCEPTQAADNRESSSVAKSFFGSDIPPSYFSRVNLSDCHDRFHTRPIKEWCTIYNGVRVNATEFPHMAVIGWPDGDENIKWKCGGSLITKKFVLTAAHCAVDEINQAPSVVRLGDVDLISNVDDVYAQQFSIVEFIRHPKHRFSSKYNDLALIELEKEIVLSPGVCPACIWHGDIFPYDSFDVAGFGATGYVEPGSPYLLKAFLKAEPRETCIDAFNTTRGLANGILDEQLCASNTNMDTCQGDSGGPLQTTLYTFRRKVAFLLAITAFGKPCGMGSSGVYQKIYPHIEWIRSIVNETLDPLECAKKYEMFLSVNQIEPPCAAGDPYESRVELIWKNNSAAPKCSGTLIDYNTVLTTASCTFNSKGEEPSQVHILTEKIQITNVQRHPEYKLGSFQNDLALLRLGLYLKNNSVVAPVCLEENKENVGISSLFIARNASGAMSHIHMSAKQRCSEKTRSMFNISELLNENYECWSTDYHMVPGICAIDQGGAFLDPDHKVLHGINIYAKDCGSYNPLITLKPNRYTDWIEAFVLDRSVIPEKPIVFPEENNSTLMFTPCTTKAGVQGKCLSAFTCGLEIEKLNRDKIGVTLCGFEDDIAYFCCPNDSIGTFRPIKQPLLLQLIPAQLKP